MRPSAGLAGVAAALAAVASIPPALAQGVSGPSATLPNLDARTIEPVLRGMGATVEPKTEPGVGAFLVALFGGARLTFFPAACHAADSGCRGLQISTTIRRTEFAVDDAELLRRINAFNARFAYGKAVLNDKDEPELIRFVIADQGMPRGNLVAEVEAMLSMIERLFKIGDGVPPADVE